MESKALREYKVPNYPQKEEVEALPLWILIKSTLYYLKMEYSLDERKKDALRDDFDKRK